MVDSGTLASLAFKSILVTAPALAIQGIVMNPADFNWVSQVERTGLLGALLLAVAILWRNRSEEIGKKETQLSEKDKQILALMEHVTAALTSQVETNRELRKVVEESVRTKIELKASIDALALALANKKD